MKKNKIVLITSGQPSLNPRLVKEADALVKAKFDVTVIYKYWNEWGTELDNKLLATREWRAIRAGGSPKQARTVYFFSRLLHKVGSKIASFSTKACELAIGRGILNLSLMAAKHKADLYIAHNLAALPAAAFAAKRNQSKYAFDAEDFHRHETSDDPSDKDVKIKSAVESKYFPSAAYITTASPVTSSYYKRIFPGLTFNTILNVFPRSSRNQLGFGRIQPPPLKLLWFSQTVGLSRGIQDVIKALRELEDLDIEFHILGDLSQLVEKELTDLVEDLKFTQNPKIIFHKPIDPDSIIDFASNFDVGLATEPGFSLNNNIALSNKLFTYINAGLAIVASDTLGQESFFKEFPGIGDVFKRNDITTLTSVLRSYVEVPKKLENAKMKAFFYGQTSLNWEVESQKFVNLVKNVINNSNNNN